MVGEHEVADSRRVKVYGDGLKGGMARVPNQVCLPKPTSPRYFTENSISFEQKIYSLLFVC